MIGEKTKQAGKDPVPLILFEKKEKKLLKRPPVVFHRCEYLYRKTSFARNKPFSEKHKFVNVRESGMHG